MIIAEVALYLRVTEKTVYRLLKQGRIPATKVDRQWRFSKASIDKWLHESSVGSDRSFLIIDDEETIRALFKETLEEWGHNVVVTSNGSEGLELVKEHDFGLVFLDLKLPGMNGAEVIRQIKATKPGLPVTIITGYPSSGLMKQAVSHGPFGVMHKPFGESDVLTAVNSFLRITS